MTAFFQLFVLKIQGEVGVNDCWSTVCDGWQPLQSYIYQILNGLDERKDNIDYFRVANIGIYSTKIV